MTEALIHCHKGTFLLQQYYNKRRFSMIPSKQICALNSMIAIVSGHMGPYKTIFARTENPCVGGSIPPHTTFKIKPTLVVGFIFSIRYSSARTIYQNYFP